MPGLEVIRHPRIWADDGRVWMKLEGASRRGRRHHQRHKVAGGLSPPLLLLGGPTHLQLLHRRVRMMAPMQVA